MVDPLPVPGKSTSRADQPIFIGGLMKSGTSLLRVLLGQHPNLFASFETHWFAPEIREKWSDPTSKRMQLLQRFFEIGEGDYKALCAIKTAEPEREFIDIVLEDAAQRAGKQRWVEKTPDNIRHWKLAQTIWPSAKLIHITREYKDCFASWKDKRGDTLEVFLDSARTAYEDIEDLLGTQSDSYMEVDYMDLTLDTKATMRKVLAFANVAWDERCTSLDLSETQAEREVVKAITGKDSNTNVSLARPIFSDSIGQWRKTLTEDEARTIDRELAARRTCLGGHWT